MSWKIVKIGSFLKRVKQAIEIEDSIEYKRITIRTKHQGIFLRDKLKGSLIGTKLQFVVREGQFLLSKIDARLGAFSIVPSELNNGIITGNFWAFDVNEKIVNIEWFNLFTSSGDFYEICNKASSGTTHRKYLDENKFLNFEITLPELPEQNDFIEKYKNYHRSFKILQTNIHHQQTYLQLLRQTILQEAVQGKLTKQEPTDEPATELLKRIKAEKEKLIKAGKLKKEKELPSIIEGEIPFELPKGWTWYRLGAIALKLTDGTHHSPPNISEGDFMYITAKNIKDAGILLEDISYVKRKVHDEIYSRCNPEYGDILYIKDGATTGVVTINNIHEPFSMLSSVALIKLPKDVLNKYLLYVLRSPYYYKATRSDMAGIAITRVTLSKMIATLIPLPPLSEQHRIVAKVEQIQKQLDQLEAQVQKNRQYSRQLLQTVLKEAFMQKQNAEVREEMSKAAEPVTNYNTLQPKHHSPAELHAMLLAKIIEAHEQTPHYLPTLGRVKGEKNCHIIESQLDIDLDRNPLKDAAGPVDFRHVLEVERLALKWQWFEAKQKKIKGKVDYIKGQSFNEALKQASDAFKGREESINRIINMFLPLDTEQTEIIATAYAAWNNLLLMKASFTDEDIITEARENWTKEKLRYFRPEFQRAIDWLRINQLVPFGKGKIVHSK